MKMFGMSQSFISELATEPNIVERFRYRPNSMINQVEALFQPISMKIFGPGWEERLKKVITRYEDEDILRLRAIPKLTEEEWRGVSAAAAVMMDYIRVVSVQDSAAKEWGYAVSAVYLVISKEAARRAEEEAAEKSGVSVQWTERLGPLETREQDLEDTIKYAEDPTTYSAILATSLIHQLEDGALTEGQVAGLRIGFSLVTSITGYIADNAQDALGREVAVMLHDAAHMCFGVVGIWFKDNAAAHQWADKIALGVQRVISEAVLKSAFAQLQAPPTDDGAGDESAQYDA